MNEWRDRTLSWERRVGALLRARSEITETLCQEWKGATVGGGYGTFRMDTENWITHRAAWIIAHGPIPEGLLVCHHCDNPPCIKTDPDERWPDGHLFLGTSRDNLMDAFSKGRKQIPDQRGELHSKQKLSRDEIAEIRRVYVPGKKSPTNSVALAQRFGISRHHAWLVAARHAWPDDE